MAETKKRNTRERSKDSGKFEPTGTDKKFPKETSISELDRPETYKPRVPKPVVEPTSPPVFPSEPVARQNQTEQSTREFDPNNIVTDEQAYLNNDQVLPPQIVRTPTDDGQ